MRTCRAIWSYSTTRFTSSCLEDLVHNRQAELVRLFEFLEVDPTAGDRMAPLALNASSSVPRGRLGSSLLNSPRARALARMLVPSPLRPRIEDLLLQQTTKSPMEPETRSLLQDFYKSDRQSLEKLLRRVLPWPVTDGKSTSGRSEPAGLPESSVTMRI